MKASTKIALVLALFGALGMGALAKTVYATSTRNSTTVAQIGDGDGEMPDATEPPENAQPIQSLAMNRTPQNIQVAEASDGDGEMNDDAEEQQEAVQLQPLANITAQQAQQAAEKAVGGQATRTILENEDGNLVYAVEIGQQEAKVDAGNGRVLYLENANSENDEATEASHPRSSIQVPHSSDRETNPHR